MNFNDIIEILSNKEGIEFGGPTELFQSNRFGLPLYVHVTLDGGNIFSDNFFQGGFNTNYIYGGKTGKQFNMDCANAADLLIPNRKYDFIVTSHVIEHVANPIKVIKAWMDTLLNDGGYILSVMPDYQFCFDRRRPLTSLEHLISDYKNDIGEDDKTHIEEQKTLHDWSYGGHPKFYELCDINEKTRVVHHHTFNTESVIELFKYCGLEIVGTYKQDDLNIVNICKKL